MVHVKRSVETNRPLCCRSYRDPNNDVNAKDRPRNAPAVVAMVKIIVILFTMVASEVDEHLVTFGPHRQRVVARVLFDTIL